MTDVGHSVLDKNNLPRVFAVLDVVFPEFGWRRTRGGWVAGNNRFTKERLGARAERVVSEPCFCALGQGDLEWTLVSLHADAHA